MALSQTTEIFNCTPEQFWKIIADYSRYHEFLSDVKSVEVKSVDSTGSVKQLEYKVHVIKTITYILEHIEKPPFEMHWKFVKGDMIKKMTGSWVLSDEAGKTKAVYSVDVDFGLFVPGAVVKTLQEVNLKNMMAAYHKRVKEMYGV